MSGGAGLGASHPSRGSRTRLLRTFAAWWVVGAALWLLLDDTVALPELIDGAVAAALGAGAATVALAGSRTPIRLPAGWARHGWRPVLALVTELPRLVGVLVGAVRTGERDPGRLRAVGFVAAEDPAARAGQVALATVAGSLAPSTVVVAVDAGRAEILVHELVPGTGRRGADPLQLG